MKTTERDVLLAIEPADARFAVAGALLALSGIVLSIKAEGQAVAEEEGRNSTILARIAAVTAEHGVDYARGWVEGYWYTTGTRDFDTSQAARRILG